MTESPLLLEPSGEDLLATVAVGVGIYVALIVLLRLTGSRSLSSLNAFDFVVTVAIGAVFGSALTADDVGFSQAFVAFALILTLQFGVSTIQLRYPAFKRVVTNPPHLLYHEGEYRHGVMADQRVTEDDVRTAARKQGIGSMADVEAVVLESSGELSVIETLGDGSALEEITSEGAKDIDQSDDDAEER